MEAAAQLVARQFRERFAREPSLVVSAPGRVNIIGEHTDYNDGFVLPMAIDRRLYIAAVASTDGTAMHVGDALTTDDSVTRALRLTRGVLDAFRELHPDARNIETVTASDVPIGSGLSSSAAFGVAYVRALCAVNGVAWEPMRMAEVARRGEARGLGVQCGIMDQAVAAGATRGRAMLLDCRSLHVTQVPLPADVAVVVMDTGVRRALSGTEYNERRATCERVAARLRVRALRDVSVEAIDAAGLDDADRRRALHVVAENERTLNAVEALRSGDCKRVGALMNESHASLRDLYEVSSPQLNAVCEIARAHPACFGARMTGAGFGGCALALIRAGSEDAFIAATRSAYEARTYLRSAFFAVRASEGARVEWP